MARNELTKAVATAMAPTAGATAEEAANTSPSVAVATGPTPDNTPVPGGGRWLWDIQKPGWVRPEGEPLDPA